MGDPGEDLRQAERDDAIVSEARAAAFYEAAEVAEGLAAKYEVQGEIFEGQSCGADSPEERQEYIGRALTWRQCAKDLRDHAARLRAEAEE